MSVCVSVSFKVIPIFRVNTVDGVNMTDSGIERTERLTLFTTAVYWEDTHTNIHTHAEYGRPRLSARSHPHMLTHILADSCKLPLKLFYS